MKYATNGTYMNDLCKWTCIGNCVNYKFACHSIELLQMLEWVKC